MKRGPRHGASHRTGRLAPKGLGKSLPGRLRGSWGSLGRCARVGHLALRCEQGAPRQGAAAECRQPPNPSPWLGPGKLTPGHTRAAQAGTRSPGLLHETCRPHGDPNRAIPAAGSRKQSSLLGMEKGLGGSVPSPSRPPRPRRLPEGRAGLRFTGEGVGPAASGSSSACRGRGPS